MPATFAFLAVGAHDIIGIFVVCNLKLRNIAKLSERFKNHFVGNPIRKWFALAKYTNFCFEGFANDFCLSFGFESGQQFVSIFKKSFPKFAFRITLPE